MPPVPRRSRGWGRGRACGSAPRRGIGGEATVHEGARQRQQRRGRRVERHRGPAARPVRRQHLLGQAGVAEQELAPLMDQEAADGETALGRDLLLEARRQLLRPAEELPVCRGQAVQVPQVGGQRGSVLGVARRGTAGCSPPRRPGTAPARRSHAGRSTCPVPAAHSPGSPSRRPCAPARHGRRRARPRRRARSRPTPGRRCGRCGCAPPRAGPGRGRSRRSPAGPAARPAPATPRAPSWRRRCGLPAAPRPRCRAAARSRRWAPSHRAATGGRRTGRTTLIGHARPIV